MRLVSVVSETIRPPQTEEIKSSFVTNAIAVFDQVDQQVEHLRLDGDPLDATA
jgi:hypothetical protein